MRTMAEMCNGTNETEFIEKCKHDLSFFCKNILGLELSAFHFEQLKMLEQRYVCIVSPRGHLKTTLFAIAYPIWRMWKDENVEICLISSAVDQSKKTFDKVQAAIEENELLKELVPEARQSPWNKLNLTCSNGSRYFIKPFNSTVRGTHVDCCICDDILREGNTERANETFWSIVFPIVQTKRGQLIVIGTPMTEDDLLSKIGKKSSWCYKRWSAIEEGEPLWPERFSIKELEAIRDAQGDYKFGIEYLCDVKESVRKAKNIFVGRKDEMEKIISSIKNGSNILIIGPLGIGKTSLLLQIRNRVDDSLYFGHGYGNLLKALSRKADIPSKNKYGPVDLAGMLKARDQKIVLLLDDVDEMTNAMARDIASLADTLVIVAAGAEEPKCERLSWLFKEKIKLKPFTMNEMCEFTQKKTITNMDNWCARKMLWMTKGIPMAVADFVNDIERKNSEDWSSVIDSIKPHPSVCALRIDIFPIVGIIVIAYLLLALRYFARAGDNTQLYLFSGTFGFVLLAIVRSLMYRKRKK